MVWVVEKPRGTASFRLRGLNIPVAGKTGTAESGSGDPHAWFAGYTMASESSQLPDIAIAVIIENQGEGSDWAAPHFQAHCRDILLWSPAKSIVVRGRHIWTDTNAHTLWRRPNQYAQAKVKKFRSLFVW